MHPIKNYRLIVQYVFLPVTKISSGLGPCFENFIYQKILQILKNTKYSDFQLIFVRRPTILYAIKNYRLIVQHVLYNLTEICIGLGISSENLVYRKIPKNDKIMISEQ